VTWRVDATGAAHELRTDRALLERVLSIAVRSACLAGARHVELAASAGDDATTIDVGDDGPPPSPSDQAQFFEPLAPHLRST